MNEDSSSTEGVKTAEGEMSSAPETACLIPTTRETSRCRHLEECMFPRYLNLDCKLLDDFCRGRVEEQSHGKNAARLYIESLHLKPFLKDKVTLTTESNAKRKEMQAQLNKDKKAEEGALKRPRLPLRRNSGETKIRSEQATKQDKGEGVTDQTILSQMYFGGFNGKRTWFLSNNGKTEAGGGIAASYCQVLPTSTVLSLNQWNCHSKRKPNPGVLKVGKKRTINNSATSPSEEKFNHILSSEMKLATLRSQLKLHNCLDLLDSIAAKSSSDALSRSDEETRLLERLIQPIAGYTPSPIDTSDSGKSENNRIQLDNKVKETSSNHKDESRNFETDRNAKSRINLMKLPDSPLNSTTGSSNFSHSVLTQAVPSDSKTTSGVPDKKEKGSIQGSNVSNSATPSAYNAAYKRVIYEGKAQAMAANFLLESFRRSRRAFWSNSRNNVQIRCAWCSFTKNGDSEKIRATGDALIQCLECDVIGCGSKSFGEESCVRQHIMLHFLLSGHRYGMYQQDCQQVYKICSS